MICIATKWYYPDASSGPVPCEWAVINWQTCATQSPDDVIWVCLARRD